ncbi:MAG TPA: SRPBCC domain-containing protein [Thermoplasmata archaeon]|nr:SRPBCC domain-containing protein [Thermoplasmata archaeon]
MSERTTPREPTVFSRPSDLENQVVRLFRAPPERLFQLFTDPSTVALVFTTDPSRATVERYDFRPGGGYSIVVRGQDGGECRFRGEYLEIVPPRRVVNTFEVSVWPGVRAVETDEFERVGESTRLTIRWKFSSRADRDRMKGVGGAGGIAEQFEHLDDVLERS